MAELITIKSSKDGLRVQLEDTSAWSAILSALQQRLANSGSFFQGGQLVLDIGERPVSEDELAELLALLRQFALQPHGMVATTREGRSAARAAGIAIGPMLRPAPPAPAGSEGEATLVWRTVRSGQVVRHPGHITVIGDVNAGAEVIAGGNVVVWGRLRGVVHAGALGDRSAIICAIELRPTQLRIADLIAQPDAGATLRIPEVARVEGDRIGVESWEAYRKS